MNDGSDEGASGISNDASTGVAMGIGDVAGNGTGDGQSVTTGGQVGWLVLALLSLGMTLRHLVKRTVVYDV